MGPSVANRTKLTPKRRQDFLDMLSHGRTVTAAARAVGVRRQAVYQVRQEDKEFRLAWEAALEEGTETLEDEARRRALEGVRKERGVYYRGELVGTEVEIEYSDTLLMFLLKARRPEAYRDNLTVRHGGDPENREPIRVQTMTAVPPIEVPDGDD